MIQEVIFAAPTVEQATEGAKAELAAPEGAEVMIEVLELPVKKTLGLFGGSPAKVRAYYEVSSQSTAETYLQTILDGLGVEDAKITLTEADETLLIQVDCDNNYGAVVGRRGETLDAIQYLTRLAINKGGAQYRRISVNVGDYREKRENTLRALARKNAERVKRYGRNVVLDPMNPYERRLIHTTIQEIEGVESHSVGSDDNRKVVITAVGGRSGGYRGGNNRDRGNSNYRGNNNYRDNNNRNRNNAPRQQRQGYSNPSRPPRSDAAQTTRYGKIEPKKDSE